VSRRVPAIEVCWPGTTEPDDDDVGRLLAALDDCHPIAAEECPGALRVFFGSEADRGQALQTIGQLRAGVRVEPLDVADESWAERSQAALAAVQVGRIVVAPPWVLTPEPPAPSTITIVIQPSMGFGTGHHASTRVCLQLLQQAPVAGRDVLDVGTGSGILALAAWRLGARQVVGVDVDPDALTSARENLGLNGAAGAIELREDDVLADPAGLDQASDIVLANLTGALLARRATAVAQLVRPGGVLFASGFQADDDPDVTEALRAAGFAIRNRIEEDGWIGLGCDR
jgi:ribosomal protein L11 methyltransferase